MLDEQRRAQIEAELPILVDGCRKMLDAYYSDEGWKGDEAPEDVRLVDYMIFTQEGIICSLLRSLRPH